VHVQEEPFASHLDAGTSVKLGSKAKKRIKDVMIGHLAPERRFRRDPFR